MDESLRHHCLMWIYLNEFMFKAGVRIPFEFGVDELLALLSRNLLHGYVTFTGKGNTKLVNNLIDLVPEWKSKFFYARLEMGDSSMIGLGWGKTDGVSPIDGRRSCPRKLLPHARLEFYDLERRIHSIDGCSSPTDYRFHILGKFPPIARDHLIMDADEHRRITEAGKLSNDILHPDKLPSVWECLTTTFSAALSEARSKTKEELKALLEQRYAKDTVEGEQRFFYELQEMGQRANRTVALEVKAINAAKTLHQDLYATQLEQEHLKKALSDANEEVINLEEALGFSAELAVARSEAEALGARVVDADDNGAKSCVELEAIRGEVSSLQGKIALQGSREEELLSKLGGIGGGNTTSGGGGGAQSLGSLFTDSGSSVIAEYLRSDVH
ncbi:hypothetical protein ACLOJK_038526 [Asimina triloba]